MQHAAQQRMELALGATSRQMPETCEDTIAEMRKVDARLYNFTVRLPQAEATEVTLEDIYLIDW